MTSIPFLLCVRLLVALVGLSTHASLEGAALPNDGGREVASWRAPAPVRATSWERQLRDSEVSVRELGDEETRSSVVFGLGLLGTIFDSALLRGAVDSTPRTSLKSGVLHLSSRHERPAIRAPPV